MVYEAKKPKEEAGEQKQRKTFFSTEKEMNKNQNSQIKDSLS